MYLWKIKGSREAKHATRKLVTYVWWGSWTDALNYPLAWCSVCHHIRVSGFNLPEEYQSWTQRISALICTQNQLLACQVQVNLWSSSLFRVNHIIDADSKIKSRGLSSRLPTDIGVSKHWSLRLVGWVDQWWVHQNCRSLVYVVDTSPMPLNVQYLQIAERIQSRYELWSCLW